MHMKVKIRKKKMTNLAMHVKAPSSRSDIRCNLDFFNLADFNAVMENMKEEEEISGNVRELQNMTVVDQNGPEAMMGGVA